MLIRLSVLLLSGLATTMAMKVQGPLGAFWCYPAVVLCYVLQPARAKLADGALSGSWPSVAMAAWSSVAMAVLAGPGVATMFAASLALVIALVWTLLHTLGDLRRDLTEQAITDPLTGAFNRRCMDACLATAIERLHRTGEPASLAMFDVDHFKAVNDELGHAAGDEALKALVAVVVGRARRLDVVFRVGGEEFALLLTGATHSDAVAVADDLRQIVAAAKFPGGRSLSISVGVSELRRDQDALEWWSEADEALYRAKRAGRNRVVGASVPARVRSDRAAHRIAAPRAVAGR